MEWEANLIESLQTKLSGAADFSTYFDFFGAETGLLILVLIATNRTVNGPHSYLYPLIPFSGRALLSLFVRRKKRF